MKIYPKYRNAVLRNCTVHTLVVAAAVMGQPVYGQEAVQSAEEPTNAGEIIVTAQRRNENLQDVPISISALSDQTLKNSRPFDSVDLSRSVPNLNVRNVGIPVAHVFIRGVGNSDFNQNTATSVGTYVDEVFIASPIQQGLPVYDLERVEVLKGPQGTLYGANTSGGALNYVSKKPSVTGDINGYFSASYGRFNERLIEGAVGMPLAEDKAGVRVAFISNVRDGTSFNTFNAMPINNRNEFGARGQLLLKPTETLSILASVSTRQRDADFGTGTGRTIFDTQNRFSHAPGSGCTPLDASNPGGTADCSALYERPGAPFQIDGLTTVGGGADTDPDPFRNPADYPNLKDRINDWVGSFRVDYDLGWMTLTGISSYIYEKYFCNEDADFTGDNVVSLTRHHTDKSFTQEVRLSTNGNGPLKAVLGAYYLRRNLNANNYFNLLGDQGFTIRQHYIDKTKDFAIFGQVGYDVTEQLTVTAGGRYTISKKDFFQTNNFTAGTSVLNPGPDIGTVIPPTYLDSKDKVWSGRLAVDYKFNRDAMVYASIARGFRGGGVTGGELFNVQALVPYKPEFITAYEVGTKTSWLDRKLTVNLGAFYYDYKDLQVFVFRPADFNGVPGSVQQTTNAAKAEVYGVELEVNARIGERLTLNVGAGYTHARYKDYIDTIAGDDFSGNRLVNAPTWDISTGFVYKAPVSETTDVELRGDISYLSAHYTDQSNLRAFRIPSDTRVDLAAAVLTKIANTKVRFEIWGRNVFNHVQPVDIVPLRAFGYDLVWFNDPVTYGAKVAVEF
ncbi:TonB-dependent receptor [Sphingobium subterraneum]|uniref:Iron complex outermembrane receptor protein n=1 Tax=Sphingobium subterraneum TaxID=627688 RepID=A0A841J3L6_9SPHN|nr:TonB-dependent receptor [Sphingobium subterraneum]MBB6125290.1 iron complex outermembrane receptor protein [Sphingobium subterraneum]